MLQSKQIKLIAQVMHIQKPTECLQEYAQISWLIEAYRVRERERDQVPGELGAPNLPHGSQTNKSVGGKCKYTSWNSILYQQL